MNLLEIVLFIFDSQSEIFNIFCMDRIDAKNLSTCFEESLCRDHKLITGCLFPNRLIKNAFCKSNNAFHKFARI